jgi:hypothetical protein
MAAKRLADARPAEPAPSAPDLDPEVAATLTLGSPDPAEVAGDGPRRWQRRLVDQFLRDMERRGPQAMPRTAEPPSKETVARFTAEMTAAMEERTDP